MAKSKKLLEQVKDQIKLRHYSHSAKAKRPDHIWPVKLQLTYIT